MGIFIKHVNERNIVLAGTVANEQMLIDGYVEYHGPIPFENNPDYLVWDSATSQIVVDTELKYAKEIEKVRTKRDQLLSDCDWVSNKYFDLQQPLPEEWATYRQALRDITVDFNPTVGVTWPILPGSTQPTDTLLGADGLPVIPIAP